MARRRMGGMVLDDTIAAGTIALQASLHAKTRLVLEGFSDDMEDYAQDNAPWGDRTGEARDGLETTIQDDHDEYELILFNTSDHGIWLEIAMSGQYQIIMPTIHHFEPLIMEALAASLP